jgi:hypothetical protein
MMIQNCTTPLRTRISLAAALGLLVGLLGLPSIAAAEKVAEPSTGVELDAQKSWDGKSYTLVGIGVRKKFGFKVYAMGLYVENVDGKRAFPSLVTKAGGSDKAKLTDGDRAQSFLIWGSFSKVGVMHFVRDVESSKIRGAFEEGLGDELSDKAAADVREAAQSFLKLCDRDLKTGDEIVLRTSADGKISVTIGGQEKGSVQNTKLMRALWEVWLGSKPVTKDLRSELVNRIDELGK